MLELKYHQLTFTIINRVPAYSEEAVAAIKKQEIVSGFSFPASVREWYSLEGAVEILRYYSTNAQPLEINVIGDWSSASLGRATEISGYSDKSLVPFLKDNESNSLLAFRVDSSPDPAVFALSKQEEWSWHLGYEHFSQFIFAWVWDHYYSKFTFTLIGNSNKPTQKDLNYLRKIFKEVLPELSASSGYRFEGAGHHLKIYVYDETVEGCEDKADWWLESHSSEALYDLAQKMKRCESFPATGFNTFHTLRQSGEAEAVLTRLIN